MTGLTPEQLATRLSGLTASEVGGLLGLSSWLNPCKLYRIKCEGWTQEETPWMARGRHLEEAAMRWYAEDAGCVLHTPGTQRHPSRPLLLATADAIATYPDGRRVVIEAKTAGFEVLHKWGAPGTDQIPETYIAQCTFQMGVLGLTEAHVPCLKAGLTMDVYRVGWDASLFEMLAGVAERFWVEHIEPRKPPRGYRPLKEKDDGRASNGGVDGCAGGPGEANHLPQGNWG